MAITVKFFAKLREELGIEHVELTAANTATARDAWTAASGGRSITNGIFCAVNQEHASFDHQLNDGDEVAFFPPVTGG